MYMKLAAYSNNPKTGGDNWDYVFFDEAQDANFFVLKLLKKQNIRKIYFVGDSRQSIYNFGGINDNVFEKIKFDKTYTLSKSFRFGDEIAKIANIILDGNGISVQGTPQEKGYNHNNCTRLYRTNSKMFKDALDLSFEAVKNNLKVKIDFMRTESETRLNYDMLYFIGLYYKYEDICLYQKYKSYIEDVKIYCSDVIKTFEKRLEETNRYKKVYNEMYDFINEEIHSMLNYAKEDDGFIDKMKSLDICKHCYNPDYIITMVTMHRSKGMEWDNVVLAEPVKLMYKDKNGVLHKNPDSIQELNLGYVSVTRARKTLDASILLQELDMYGIDTKDNSFMVKDGKLD